MGRGIKYIPLQVDSSLVFEEYYDVKQTPCLRAQGYTTHISQHKYSHFLLFSACHLHYLLATCFFEVETAVVRTAYFQNLRNTHY